MSNTTELWEGLIELRLRQETHIIENQFDFVLGRFFIEVIYLLWRLMERYQNN